MTDTVNDAEKIRLGPGLYAVQVVRRRREFHKVDMDMPYRLRCLVLIPTEASDASKRIWEATPPRSFGKPGPHDRP